MTDLQIPKLHFEALRIFHARASNLFSTFSQFFFMEIQSGGEKMFMCFTIDDDDTE